MYKADQRVRQMKGFHLFVYIDPILYNYKRKVLSSMDIVAELDDLE